MHPRLLGLHCTGSADNGKTHKTSRVHFGAEQGGYAHWAGSLSAGWSKECDRGGMYIDHSRLLPGSGPEAFSFANSTYETPASEGLVLPYYNPDDEEVAGFSFNGGVPPPSYDTSMSG